MRNTRHDASAFQYHMTNKALEVWAAKSPGLVKGSEPFLTIDSLAVGTILDLLTRWSSLLAKGE